MLKSLDFIRVIYPSLNLNIRLLLYFTLVFLVANLIMVVCWYASLTPTETPELPPL